MIPVFVALPRCRSHGKVDRRALPAPADAAAPAPTSYAAPRSPAELLVAGVWRELLGVERIALADNFLDLGGHSLLIMQAVAKLEARTGKRVSPRAFIFQNLEQLAHEYDADAAPTPPTSPTRPTPTPTPTPPTSRLRRWLSSLK
jgi:hypothetical protein